MNLDKLRWSRQTYSLLDWLGDLGGLHDALLILCRLLIDPVSSFALQMTLLTTFFRTDSPKSSNRNNHIEFQGFFK